MKLFEGDSYKAQYALITYRLLMTRKWVCYQDIVDFFYKDFPAKKQDKLKDNEGYGDLKKAAPLVMQAIRSMLGDSAIEEEGNNRTKRFRYVGSDENPLEDLLNRRTIGSLKEFWNFCRDSAGFIPESWLEYFFKDTHELLELKSLKNSGKQLIHSEINRGLNRIELLPFLYDNIKKKNVLKITYGIPHPQEFLFHPHLLKEFNGRWFLFGFSNMRGHCHNLALDRIIGVPEIISEGMSFVECPQGQYEIYFRDIVGVTHDEKWTAVEEIVIRAHNFRMFNLIDTKRFHHSQQSTKNYGNHADGKYGEFTLKVKINNELIGRILQLGAGIEVVSPANVRDIIRKRIANMMGRYL